MAPRRRSRKRFNTRMDAAIDAMKPFGFSRNLVVKTIKELHNVYGEEGWPFIEDASYKVLLEAILEKVNGEGTNHSRVPAAETSSGTLEPACSSNVLDPASETNEALGAEKLKNESELHLNLPVPAAETSSGTREPPCPDVNPPNTALQTSNVLNPASETNEALDAAKLTNESEGEHFPSAKAGSSERKHVRYPSSTSHSASPLTHNPPLPDSNSTRQRGRRPYYGWICSDDEEDLVVLRPGPLGEEIDNRLSSLRLHRERKKRWDVKPEDV